MAVTDTKTSANKKGLRNLGGAVLKWLLPLALTVLLVTYMFQKVNFTEMWSLIKHGVDYWWIVVAVCISVLSHIFRALRWRIQLRGLGINAPITALSCSIFGCYALNLVFPRLGEVWRCTYVARREKAPFTEVLGSMVGDRLTDTLTGFFLVILTFIVARGSIESFMEKYKVGRGLLNTVESPWFWIAIVATAVIVYAFFHFGSERTAVRKAKQWLRSLWEGFSIIGKMKHKWGFVILSFCIWGCYFLQLYVAFFAFSFTRELVHQPGLAFGLIPCLVAFVFSSVGMAIPSNGGLGPWNIAIIFGLAIYGVTDAQGTAFSMLVWSAQTVMLIILGIFTMAYISFDKRDRSALKAADKSMVDFIES